MRTLEVTGLIVLVLLAACRQGEHRVKVAYPEQWPDGNYINCFLSGSYKVLDEQSLGPFLDCDRFVKGEVVHMTPSDRNYVIDVLFLGKYETSKETEWTCQRVSHGLQCRPLTK